MTNKATWEEAVKLICSIRKGGMDDKQFEATVEHNISSLLLSQRKELMEAALAGIPPEKVLPKDKCLNLENHMYGSCFQCERLKGFNDCRQEVLTLITSILSQDT